MSGRRKSVLTADIPSELKVGIRAQVQGKIGVIRFVGTTSFQTGKWVGIELDDPQGKNSGVVQGKRYFECKLNHGVFVRPSQVKIINDQVESSASSNDSSPRFAPQPDPQLSRQMSASSSSTLLPSRITSPTSRLSRLPQTPTATQARKQYNKSSLTPTASVTMSPPKKKKSPQTRARSGTIGTSSLKETKLQQLRLQRLSQQQVQQQVPEQTESSADGDAEDEADDSEQPEEVETEGDGTDTIENEEYDQYVTSPSISNPPSHTSSTQYSKPNNNTNRTSSYGSLAANLPISKSEQTVPLKDFEELRLKLKILETKRQEDREKYREHEKVKEEAEQFLTLRNKLQDKISELQKELRDTKRQLKETTNDEEMYETKYNEVIESLEMITLDKEVAEERAENLQQEVNVLKDKIEEISVDLDILKKEADIMNRIPEKGDGNDEKTPLEVIQLERHNERLKEALMRLRDATTARENELSERIKDLERDTYELEEFKSLYEKTKERLDETEYLMEDLKQRLDDALGAEDLVEQLTEKNLLLAEKLDESRMVIEDLEALKELADELEENHIETEKQLEAEIDHRDMLLREQLERLRFCEETNVDYEATIQQFRELVTTLQNDLDQFKHKEVSQQSERQTLSSQSQAMMSLNMQLQSTVMKAQAKSIDLELRKLDAAQANDRLSYIQPYLPDSFFKTENDAISCLLLYKRLRFKAELIIRHLDQNHPISERIMDTVPENLVAVCEMRQRAGWLSDLSKRFVTFVENCQPMTFIKMGQVYHDLVGTERRLTAIVEYLRTDEINETECVTDLQRMIAQLEHLSEIHLATGNNSHHDQFFGLTRALDLNADRMLVELTFVKQTVDNAANNEDLAITEGAERLDYDYLEPLGRLITQAKNSKMLSKKLLRQLEDLSEQALTLKSEYLHRFKTLYAISSKLGRFCYETYKQIAAYVSAKVDSKEEISLGIIQQMVYNKADEVLEIAESTMWEGCLKTLKSLTNELGNTFERVQNENKTEKIATGVSPWIQRASDMKAEVVMNHDMERKLQQHSDEILKLIKDVKLKDQSLQESNVKIELLEKRTETIKKQADQIVGLEEQLGKSQTQEQMYAEAIDNLQAEFDALEQENAQLKKKNATNTKKEDKRISIPKKSSEYDLDHDESNSAMEMDSITLYEMNNQLEALKSAIRYLRAENAHLKGSDLARSLQLSHLPKVVQQQQQSTSDIEKDETEENEEANNNGKKSYSDQDIKDMIRSFAIETRVLTKDIRTTGASPRVVQLSGERRNGKWQSHKKLPNYQYQTQQSLLYTLNQRCEQLKQKMSHIQSNNKRYNEETKIIDKKESNLSLSRSLAKVALPLSLGTQLSNNKRCIQLQSISEFERIHSIFVR